MNVLTGNTRWVKTTIGIVLILLLFPACESPTGGDFVRPYVTFSGIPDTQEANDDTLLVNHDILLNAQDNEGIEKVELYIIYLTGPDSVIPVQAFNSVDKEADLSYTWAIDNNVLSGQYKLLAGIFDDVGNYYQEFRTILVRGLIPGDVAMSGNVDLNGTALADAQVSWYYAASGSVLPTPGARNSGVSLGDGRYKLLSLSPDTSAYGPTAYAFGEYTTASELYKFYDSTPIAVDSNTTYPSINLGIHDGDRNYDQLQINNISPTTPQEIFVDTSSQFLNKAEFSLDYSFRAADAGPAVPGSQDAWLVIGVGGRENTLIVDSTAVLVPLGVRDTIGFTAGVSAALTFQISAPKTTPNESYEVFATFVYANTAGGARNIYYDKVDSGNTIKVGDISVLIQ